MMRLTGFLVLLVLLAPAALAAPGEPLQAPDEDAFSALDAAQAAGAALGSAAGAATDGAQAAVGAVGSAAAALGRGIAAAAGFVADLIAAAGVGIWNGLLATLDFLGAAVAFVGTIVAAAGRGLASLAAGAGRLVGEALATLGGLLGRGAAWSAAHPRETALVAGSTAAAGGLAYLLKRLGALGGLGAFLPLYSRLMPSQMLDNAARAGVYEHVKANPGVHPSAIGESLGLGWGTVVYHLSKLEEARLVTSRSAHNRKCYFVVGGELDAEGRTAVAALATDKARAIVQAVRAQPGITQKDLAERVGMSQALASWHVKRLVGAGVLRVAREGRSNMLHVAEHVPDLPPAAPVGVPVAA